MKYLVYTTNNSYDEYSITILRLTKPNRFLIFYSYSFIRRKRISKKILDFLFMVFTDQIQYINNSGILAEDIAKNIGKTKKLGTMRRILEETEVLKKVGGIYIR